MSTSSFFLRHDNNASQAGKPSTGARSAVQPLIERKPKRIGWWRGVPYEIAEAAPLLRVIATRTVYFRGGKTEVPVYEFDGSLENQTVCSGFWRGCPVKFFSAKRATVV